MKTRKKIISLALCASLVLGLTACSQEDGGGSNDGGNGTGINTSNTADDDLVNPVDINEFVDEEATLENPNLTYFGFYDMRVAGDIKPGVKLFEETYGGTIEYLQVSWGGQT